MRAALLMLLLSGCLQGTVDQIPCDGDGTCPTGYYCSSVETCSTGGPANDVLVGAGASRSGPFADSVDVIVGQTGAIWVDVKNTGRDVSDNTVYDLTAPACLGASVEPAQASDLNPGDDDIVTIDIAPQAGCGAGIVALHITASYRGASETTYTRTWDGTFAVTVH